MSCGRGDSAKAGASDVRVHQLLCLGKVVQPQSSFPAFDDWCGEKDGRRWGGRGEPFGIAPWIVECPGSTPRCRQLGL